MPTPFSDFLVASGVANRFVRFVSNTTGLEYISSVASSTTGYYDFSVGLDPDSYRVYLGPPTGASGPPWGNAVDPNFIVPIRTGDSATVASLTAGTIPANPGQVLGKTIGDYIYVPGGYALTDVGVQNAVNDSLAGNGGVVDLGNHSYAFNGTVVGGANPAGKSCRIIGAGIGSCMITQTADAPAFQLRGYLTEMGGLQIRRTGGTSTAAVEVLDTLAGTLPGRVKLGRVQAQGFKDGLLVDPAHGIDQLWIDECLFSGNTQDGIHIVPGGGTALIDIQRSNTNANGRHGINIFTSSIIGHINIRQPESVGNGSDSCRIEGSGTNTIVSVILENPDFEGVLAGSGSNAALHAIYVWKLHVVVGQYSAQPGVTAFAGIWLENCRETRITSPWIRRPTDGMGTCTNEVYVSGISTRSITGSGFTYFGTPFDFTIDGTVPAGQVINEDNVVVMGRALSAAVGQVVPGATSFSLRNNANTNDNLILTDAGAATFRNLVTISSGGLTVLGGIKMEAAGGGLLTGVVNFPTTGGLGVEGVKTVAVRNASGSPQFDLLPQSLGAITTETPAAEQRASTMTITAGFATQRFNWIRQPTVSAATSQTITDAATLAIEGAPLATGAGPAVLTRKYQLWLQGTDYLRYDATTGVGNGALTNMQAPAFGTGSGPANPLAVVAWEPRYNGTTVGWVPICR